MIDYYDQPTGRLENEHLILDYLRDCGPRIVRLIPKQLGQNLLAETPDFELPSPHGPYRLWGGHRLWHAPESAARTYLPDDTNFRVANISEWICLSQTDHRTGIRKELAILLVPDEPRVRLEHRLTNIGLWPASLAPWAITQLRLGGTAVLPTTGYLDSEGLLPDRLIALWSYSRWDDPRFRPGEQAIEIRAETSEQPFKLGYMNRVGWMAYHTEGFTFTKRWSPQPERQHVDFGCNAEIYVNDRHIELETLGPLVSLAPGETAVHVEEWEVINNQAT